MEGKGIKAKKSRRLEGNLNLVKAGSDNGPNSDMITVTVIFKLQIFLHIYCKIKAFRIEIQPMSIVPNLSLTIQAALLCARR